MAWLPSNSCITSVLPLHDQKVSSLRKQVDLDTNPTITVRASVFHTGIQAEMKFIKQLEFGTNGLGRRVLGDFCRFRIPEWP